ncbi:hypothetical protein SAY87_010161 [Trapa incisa]|uniref:WRKY domain-containing protein n=1 Tax=Trapa incisa TaxID=236973 RepID=A0AAN7GTR1_9MYRT|nr:hypothetical protein SAY87_010161 [Trapa incisa]
MDEFMCWDGWDLDAVMRGYMSQSSSTAANLDIMEWPFDSFTNGPDLMRSTCDTLHGLQRDDNITAVTNEARKLQERAGSSAVSSPANVDDAVVYTTRKYKRRKNQHKRVVQHVTAEGIVASDPWAWRKYGQKPIRGSPYPRQNKLLIQILILIDMHMICSAYGGVITGAAAQRDARSESKSSRTAQNLTYLGEHSHGHPTRRSALSDPLRRPLARI